LRSVDHRVVHPFSTTQLCAHHNGCVARLRTKNRQAASAGRFAERSALCYRCALRICTVLEGLPMTIKVGDKVPSVTLRQVTPEGPKEVTSDEFFRGRKVVLFAVPGAFTPACSQRHLPGYVDKAGDIKAKGIDEVACVAVNDAAVMGAWGKDQKTEGKVTMLADGSGDFVRALGLELDLSKGGLGVRSKRYSMLIDNGVVKSLNVEAQPGQVDASSAEAMLKALV
jgi:peroxiredoxin